jgi:hypothetical protein
VHLILQNHLSSIENEFEYSGFGESKLFEFFSNYCVISRHFFGRFDPQNVTTKEDDASIDGIAFIVDGDLILTEDDAIVAFDTHKPNLQVDVIFNQAKSGESFRKEEIANFAIGLQDFFSEDQELPAGEFNKNAKAIMHVVFGNLRKVKNRRPSIHIYYCTSGTYRAEREISGSFEIIKRNLVDLEYFHHVEVSPMGRSELLKQYADLTEKTEAKLILKDYASIPAAPPAIPQSYVGVVNAKHFVERLLMDADGNLKHSVFEENVRSFLGDDNPVNAAMSETLSDSNKRKLFSVLNNGITIVSPQLALAAHNQEMSLSNYQIINGCQTSSTLHANFAKLNEDVNVVVKFIESTDDGSAADIISATNSQSNVPQEAFFGLRTKAKLVRKYFDAQNTAVKAESLIYFERRQGEFRGAPVQATRIFDVREIARCYAAMFLNQPHNSARYVNAIFNAGVENLFRDDDHEGYYYAACLALYKYQTLINGRKISAPNYAKLRFHIIQLFKWFVHAKMEVPPPNSGKAPAYAKKLIDVLNSDDKRYIAYFELCQRTIDKLGAPSDDSLKRGKFSSELQSVAATLINDAAFTGSIKPKKRSV